MMIGRDSQDPRQTHYWFNWPFQGDRYGSFPWNWQRMANPVVATELYHGAYTWDRFLRKGLDPAQLRLLPWLPRGEPRKWYMAGGSDSHGDLNYRRAGRPCLDRWCDVPVSDTAIGNPRNLVSLTGRVVRGDARLVAAAQPPATGPRRYTNAQVVNRLRAGDFSVTDGPAIRIAMDNNRNGEIDDSDFPMGSTVHFYPGEHIPLLVEWLSTPEFGRVSQVDIYVGSPTETFAPRGHGPLIPPGGGRNGEFGPYRPDPSGVLQVRLTDELGRYSLTDVPQDSQYHGIVRVFIGPAQFGLARADQALSYVRAFVKTVAPGQGASGCPERTLAGNRCGNRFGYANPIWMRYQLQCAPVREDRAGRGAAILGAARPFLDGNFNGRPDTCERDIPSPCGVETGGRGGRFGVDVGIDPRDVKAERPGRAGSGPAKPIPASSCQKVAALPR
jgi:hypothetical protein